MSYINSQQLAFVLEISKEDARAKMCVAWERENGIQSKTIEDGNSLFGAVVREKVKRNNKKKIVDDYPLTMAIEMLSRQLNIPDLQTAITDIKENFLKRPAYKKWILHDYPESVIKKCQEAGKPKRINIPPALKSLLSTTDVLYIKTQWQNRYPNIIV